MKSLFNDWWNFKLDMMDLFRTREIRYKGASYSIRETVVKETKFGKWFVGKPVILYWFALCMTIIIVSISSICIWPIYLVRLIFKNKKSIDRTFVE